MKNDIENAIILPHKKILESPISISSIHSIYTHTHKKGFIFGGESHPFYEINIVSDGILGLTVDDKLYELKKGHAVLIPAGSFHKNWTIGQSAAKFFVVSFDITTNGVPLPDDAVYSISEIDNFYVDRIINEGLEWFEGKSNHTPFAPQIIKNSIECLIISMLRQHPESSKYVSNSGEVFYRAIHYMNLNIKSNLTVEDLARYANTSVANLKKTFKKYTGTGAIHHFNLLKLEHAKELLKNDMPISEVAYSLSYSSQNHFAQSFKKAFGVTPSQFKKI